MASAAVTPGDLFAFPAAQTSRLSRAAIAAARPFLESTLGIPRLRALHDRTRRMPGGTFEARVLQALQMRFRVEGAAGARVPHAGPLIVVANHPTGAADGLVLGELIRQVRPDVRTLTNSLLSAVPELRDVCFFVDPFGGAAGAARSRAGLRAAHLWLRAGGALLVFPAGEVSPSFSRRAEDGPWHDTVGRLALATGAQVLPVWIHGRNSNLFYAAGRIHPRLRTLLLGRELLKQEGSMITVTMGAPVTRDTLRGTGSAAAATALLRQACDALAGAPATATPAPIAAPIDTGRLAEDVRQLDAGDLLLSSGPYDVYCGTAARLASVLDEIGRLRELTFRAVGEGTGRARDLDDFDRLYEHLFVWHRERREIVGAYRLGRTDRILGTTGLAGLYTSTLFRYDARVVDALSCALELGRAFVRPEYQRTYNALLLLWKGIGRYVARHPQYRVLFGPVSVSSRYQDRSQQLLRALLVNHHRERALAPLVSAVNQPAPLTLSPAAPVPASAEELDALIRQIEGSGQGVPILLRQYLRLNATLLGFNVDPAFGGALDALMMVDLARVPAATLARYMGEEEARALLARHAAAPEPAAA